MELQLPGANEQQLREFVNIQQQGRLLIKDPERKYTDQFKGFVKIIILSIFLLIVQFLLMNHGKYTAYLYVLIACTLFMLFMAILSLLAMHSRLKTMLSQTGSHVVRFTPTELEHVSSRGDKLTVQWANVKFIRIFKEMIAFFPNGPEGILIGIDAKYAPMILDYLHANNINIQVIAGEKK